MGIVAYGMATPVRYDVACWACSFTPVCLPAGSVQHSLALFLARIWETGDGIALGAGVGERDAHAPASAGSWAE